MDFADRVAEFVITTTDSSVPPDDRRAVKRSLIDTLGTALAGTVSEPGRGLLDFTRACEPPGVSSVPGTGLRRAPGSAALLIGSFAHSDDFDDMGGYGHPSAPMLGALLPTVEELRHRGVAVSGAELVTAHAIGFELGVALCGMGSYDQYERCFHSTPVFGALAATCAVGRLRRFAPDTLALALRHVARSFSGLGRNSGTMVKPVHAGLASRSALAAADAAENGVEIPDGIFESKGGFIDALFGHRSLDLDAVATSLGNPWRFARTVSIKRFPCCGSNHSALNAVESLLSDELIDPQDIEEIVVHGMIDSSPVLRFPEVVTGCSAKFSIQYTIATLIVKGALTVADFRDEAVADLAVASLAQRVHPAVVNRWDTQGASKQKGNPVSVLYRDGRRREAAVARTEILGGPRRPLPNALLHQKYLENAELAIGRERAASSLAGWDALDASDDVAALIEAVR